MWGILCELMKWLDGQQLYIVVWKLKYILHAEIDGTVLCTQVNMMFVMLLWVYIHTGQAEKFAWPRWQNLSCWSIIGKTWICYASIFLFIDCENYQSWINVNPG
jgi:hypothetical protein